MKQQRRTFIKQVGYSTLGLGLMPFLQQCQSGVNTASGRVLERATPASQGVSPKSIIKFLEAAKSSRLEWHSFMLLRHGKVVAEAYWSPFRPDFKHALYSLSKSFTSTAVGLAIEEGLLTLEDKVASFFPDQMPSDPSTFLQDMDIRDLLTMNTGHTTDSFNAIRSNYEEDWVPTFLAHPVEKEPGSSFLYDTGATFMLSAILQKQTGETVEEYLRPRLFEPLGIEDYDWQKSPEGYNTGGFGLRLSTESLARFGQLYLQKGKWKGEQIVPEAWVTEATKKQTDSNDGDSEWSQGYGYQFWCCKANGVYRGDGAFGQFCIVMPEQDAVLVATSESENMGLAMQVLFDNLLPGFSEEAIPTDKKQASELSDMIARLKVPLPRVNIESPTAHYAKGKIFQVEANDFGVKRLRFDFTPEQCKWTWETDDQEVSLTAGLQRWYVNEEVGPNLFPVFFRTDIPSKVAATATWMSDHVLQLNLKFVEAIHGDQIVFNFSHDKLIITMTDSVTLQNKGEVQENGKRILKAVILTET